MCRVLQAERSSPAVPAGCDFRGMVIVSELSETAADYVRNPWTLPRWQRKLASQNTKSDFNQTIIKFDYFIDNFERVSLDRLRRLLRLLR